MNKNRLIVLDVETTGLDYLFNDRIVEIGAIELIDNKTLGKEFHFYVNPLKKLSLEVQKIHGITDDFLKDKPFFEDIAEDFLNFISNSTLIAHNAEFDRRFINLELGLLKKPIKLPKSRFIDSLVIAKMLFKGEKASLDDLCSKFNIDISSREKHGALIDSKLLAQVYIEIYNLLDKDNKLKQYTENYINHIQGINKHFNEQSFAKRNFN